MINRTDRQCNEYYRPLCDMTNDECYKALKSKQIDAAQKESGKTNYQREIKNMYNGEHLRILANIN
jgi:hypothetical protein